jgi:hypothetical protein
VAAGSPSLWLGEGRTKLIIPLPFIPSHQGRGDFLDNILYLRIKE